MPDDLKRMLKEIRDRNAKNRSMTIEKVHSKPIDIDEQMELFKGYLTAELKFFKKSEDEGDYLKVILKETERMSLSELRYVIEKSYDRYDRVLNMMKKYEENFSEDEMKKYMNKFSVLNKLLTYMVQNNLGEYNEIPEV